MVVGDKDVMPGPGYGYGTIFTSERGFMWDKQNSGVAQDLASVAYANNRFVAIGASDTILTSDNGTNWVKQAVQTKMVPGSTMPVNVAPRRAIGGGGTRFVALYTGDTVVTSTDGVAWREETRFSSIGTR